MEIPFDRKYLPTVFGLENSGRNFCYINSLLQCLAACTSFNTLLTYSKCDLACEYCCIINNQRPVRRNAYNILAILSAKRKGKNNNLLIGRQEDAHEGFIFLIEELGEQTAQLFYCRYKTYIDCAQCGDYSPAGDGNPEPPELVMDLTAAPSEVTADQKKLEKYIMSHGYIPRDYRCEKCGAQNGEHYSPVSHIYVLARLSSILVILIKKYNSVKAETDFPHELHFRSKSGFLYYKLVSQLEHYGKNSGGHYLSRAWRRRPPGFKMAEDEGVFLFDDEKVRHCPRGFAPNSHIYMLFYHLYI